MTTVSEFSEHPALLHACTLYVVVWYAPRDVFGWLS